MGFVFTVKRYVRKGVPNEHRPQIWMAASGAQEQLEKNPGYYHSLLATEHDPKLEETIRTGQPPSSVTYLLTYRLAHLYCNLPTCSTLICHRVLYCD